MGCGPCGELRYPSYPLAPREHYPTGWRWPGLGELQCYDKGMLSGMAAALDRAEPPQGVGEYNDAPDDTRFWAAAPGGGGCLPSARRLWRRGRIASGCCGGSGAPKERFDSESGARFLAWYSDVLVAHGGDVMRAARRVFGPRMRLACKVRLRGAHVRVRAGLRMGRGRAGDAPLYRVATLHRATTLYRA